MPAVRLGTSALYFFQCVTRATGGLAPAWHSAYYGYQSLSDTPTGNNPMRWFKHEGLSALYGRLSGPTPDPERMVHRVEDIRVAMLDMLGELGEQTYPQVARRIRYGGDALALWYARADLMAALAGLHGEQLARTRMVSLLVLFEGTLPKGMASRPSTLSRF